MFSTPEMVTDSLLTMKTVSDDDIVEILKNRFKFDTYGVPWDPINNLGHAWALHSSLKDTFEFPLFLSLADDGGMYYRATVNHQYDYMTVSSAVDNDSPCRAILRAVYDAVLIMDCKKDWDKSPFWGMWSKPQTPKVGVGVVLRRKNKVLMGLRKGAHGQGEWSLPGGHMELGECFPDVCAREVKEETGITIQGVKKQGFTNDIFETDGLHYVTLFFEALWDTTQEAQNLEPDKTVEWQWFDIDDLPDNMFPPLVSFLANV